jgi:hypothetical protein
MCVFFLTICHNECVGNVCRVVDAKPDNKDDSNTRNGVHGLRPKEVGETYDVHLK